MWINEERQSVGNSRLITAYLTLSFNTLRPKWKRHHVNRRLKCFGDWDT